jgi:hypothetical protein
MVNRLVELIAERKKYSSDALLASDEPEKLARAFKQQHTELSNRLSEWLNRTQSRT